MDRWFLDSIKIGKLDNTIWIRVVLGEDKSTWLPLKTEGWKWYGNKK